MMITSTKNPRIQRIRKLQGSTRNRKKESAFVIEGIRLVEEALNSRWQPQEVLYTEDIDRRGLELVAGFRDLGVEMLPVADHVMAAASDTQTPQGILAVLPLQNLPIPENANFFLIPDGMRDPGNLGTMLRTALAAGVDAVLLPPGTVDPFSPKVVRAGMGAHFRLPIYSLDWDAIREQLTGKIVYLADSAGGQPHHKSDFVPPLALIIGGEAEGAGVEGQNLATQHVHISMPGQAESLNAAIAAAVLLFEVVRQRQLSEPDNL